MTEGTESLTTMRRPIARGGPGRFVTHFVFEEHPGHRFVWHSRRNRKGLDPEPATQFGQSLPNHALVIEPRRLPWWIGALFMVGASLFSVGSFGMWLDARFPGAPILFTGSLFFTSAAYLQFVEVLNEPHPHTAVRPNWRFLGFEPDRIGWWATAIQLVGTLLFNLNTFEATRTLGVEQQLWCVWSPNAAGSICFLVASYLAYAEVSNAWWIWQPGNISWWIVVINLAGSIAFGVSAIAGFVEPSSGTVIDSSLSNATTFAGAVCFFVGAYLLIPEMTAHASKVPNEG